MPIVTYPHLYTRFCKACSEIFSLQFLADAIPVECFHNSKKSHFYAEFIFETAGPIGVVALGAALYYVAMKYGLRSLCTDTAQLQERKKKLHGKCMEALFLFTYVVYVPSRCVCLFILFRMLIQTTEYFQRVRERQ